MAREHGWGAFLSSSGNAGRSGASACLAGVTLALAAVPPPDLAPSSSPSGPCPREAKSRQASKCSALWALVSTAPTCAACTGFIVCLSATGPTSTLSPNQESSPDWLQDCPPPPLLPHSPPALAAAAGGGM